MIKKIIKYTDYNGNQREEDFYFNLTKAELSEWYTEEEGGMEKYIGEVVLANDEKTAISIFKELILRSYGEKSADGKRFIKSEELSTAFSQTEAYSILFMELATDDKKAAEFVNGITPQNV